MTNKTDEQTSKVLYENNQWRVTASGMESVKPAPTYELSANRLLEERDGYYNWPVHMAEKAWLDIETFIEPLSRRSSFTRANSMGQSTVPN